MAISKTLKRYLDKNNIRYTLVAHAYTESSTDSARSAHIPLQQMAKAVVLEDEQGYIVGVLLQTTASNLTGSTRNSVVNLAWLPKMNSPYFFPTAISAQYPH